MFKDVIKKEFEKGALKVNLGNDNIVEILLDEVRAGTAGDFLSYYFASAKIIMKIRILLTIYFLQER